MVRLERRTTLWRAGQRGQISFSGRANHGCAILRGTSWSHEFELKQVMPTDLPAAEDYLGIIGGDLDRSSSFSIEHGRICPAAEEQEKTFSMTSSSSPVNGVAVPVAVFLIGVMVAG